MNMPKSDACGYEIFEGGVIWFSGKSWEAEKSAAGLKKVPGYIRLGRSERRNPRRSDAQL
jgi:hypothetical protein